MKNKILGLSTRAAILIMAICILLGVVLGNRNALNQATANAEKGFAEVAEGMKDRIGKAKTLLNKANEYIPGDEATKALIDAIAQAEKAKGQKAVASADAKIANAAANVHQALPAAMSAADQRYAVAAWDELVSVDKQINRLKRNYNEGFQEAIDVYRMLPARWLLKNPEGVLI